MSRRLRAHLDARTRLTKRFASTKRTKSVKKRLHALAIDHVCRRVLLPPRLLGRDPRASHARLTAARRHASRRRPRVHARRRARPRERGGGHDRSVSRRRKASTCVDRTVPSVDDARARSIQTSTATRKGGDDEDVRSTRPRASSWWRAMTVAMTTVGRMASQPPVEARASGVSSVRRPRIRRHDAVLSRAVSTIHLSRAPVDGDGASRLRGSG